MARISLTPIINELLNKHTKEKREVLCELMDRFVPNHRYFLLDLYLNEEVKIRWKKDGCPTITKNNAEKYGVDLTRREYIPSGK